MSLFVIYDAVTGDVSKTIRASAATAALNTPPGFAALEVEPGVVIDQRAYVDLTGLPFLGLRPEP